MCAQSSSMQRAPGIVAAIASPIAGGVEVSCRPTTTVVGTAIAPSCDSRS